MNVTLDWTFAHENAFYKVVWSKNGTAFMAKLVTESQVFTDGSLDHIRHIANGRVVIMNVTVQDSGLYGIFVLYNISAQLPSLLDNTSIFIAGIIGRLSQNQ